MNTTMAPFEHVDTRHASMGAFKEKDVQEVGARWRSIGNLGSKRDGEGNGEKKDDGMEKPGEDGTRTKIDTEPAMKGSSSSPNISPDPGLPPKSPNYPTTGPPTQSQPRPFVAASPTTVISTISAPAMTMTIVVTTTATSITPSIFTSSSASIAPSSNSSLPIGALAAPTSVVASSSSSTQTITVYATLPDPSDQPRKGLEGNKPTTTTVWATASFIAESALSAPTSSLAPDNNQSHHQNNIGGQLSPVAEDLLIAAGAIGAFIMVAVAIWFIARIRKIDLLAPMRSNRGRRGSNQENYYTDPPPQYAGIYANEKAMATQRSQQNEPYYSPTKLVAMPALIRTNSQRQEVNRGVPMDNPSTFTQMMPPVEQNTPLQTLYNAEESTGNLSRQGTQTTQVSAAHSGYNNAGTQQTFQTLGVYDPNQREVNRLSFLSSLSSGFGDGLIMPEPTVVGANDTRKSYRDTRQFSWMTAQDGTRIDTTGNRDTIYTTASVETAPRFRTVHSWVAQQSGRVGRQEQSDREVPNMPPMPTSQQYNNMHSRNQSEDPAFRHHPGDELSLGRGSRVPSSILDRKVNVNSR